MQLPPRPMSPGEPAREESQSSTQDSSSTEEPARVGMTIETPATSLAPSEAESTQPTTPSSAAPASTRSQATAPVKPFHRSNPSAVIIPAIPNIPLPTRPANAPTSNNSSAPANGTLRSSEPRSEKSDQVPEKPAVNDDDAPAQLEALKAAPEKAPPKSWADLVRAKPNPSSASMAFNPHPAQGNGAIASKAGSLSEALSFFNVNRQGEETRTAFLEPRGLVNTGNMCYMNSVGSCSLRYGSPSNFQVDTTGFSLLRSFLCFSGKNRQDGFT